MMLFEYIVSFIAATMLILINALIDDYLYDNKCYDDGNHPTRFIIRLAVLILLGYFVFNWKFIIGTGLLFTALYDYVLNCIRELPFNHLGENFTDKIWKKLGEKTTIIIKAVLFIAGCYFLIL